MKVFGHDTFFLDRLDCQQPLQGAGSMGIQWTACYGGGEVAGRWREGGGEVVGSIQAKMMGITKSVLTDRKTRDSSIVLMF